METAVLVALITAAVSLLIGLLNLTNQKRLERLKKNLDFETLRFDKLHEVKQNVIELAENNKHSVTLALANRKEGLSQDDRQNLIMQYQELQVQAVALARQIFRRNKHLLDQDLRQRLEEMVEIMNSNAHASIATEIKQSDVTKLLEERINMLEEFIPKFEDRLDKQLDRISKRLSDS